jgi:hypothetical protein
MRCQQRRRALLSTVSQCFLTGRIGTLGDFGREINLPEIYCFMRKTKKGRTIGNSNLQMDQIQNTDKYHKNSGCL